MRLQRSSFLNADEFSFLDDSTVACTQETFEDGPPKSFLSGQTHHCDIIRRKCLHERSLGSPWPELSSMDEHAAKSSFGYLSYHIGPKLREDQPRHRSWFLHKHKRSQGVQIYRWRHLESSKGFPTSGGYCRSVKSCSVCNLPWWLLQSHRTTIWKKCRIKGFL